MKKHILFWLVVILLSGILLVVIFGRQAVTYIAIKKAYKNRYSFLQIIPEQLEIDKSIDIRGYDFFAYGYKVKVPFKSNPDFFINSSMKTGTSFDSNGFSVVFHRPNASPLKTHTELLIDAGLLNDVEQFEKLINEKYNSFYAFVRSSFDSTPSVFSVLFSNKNSKLLLYKQTTKYSHVLLRHTDKRIYFFETSNCKGFQVGELKNEKNVTLWLYPNDEIEIQLDIIAAKGNLSQIDIGMIILSFSREGDIYGPPMLK